MVNLIRLIIILTILSLSTTVRADVSRVYHPYVEQYEREIEYGFTWRNADSNDVFLQRAGVGYGWTDTIFTEIYLLTESITHDGEKIRGYEAEIKWQLTEQGEYSADWGLLFEVGTADDIDRHEVAAGLLWEKEIGQRWSGTVNGFIEYEFGNDIQHEVETGARAQLRYRHTMEFEPAIEIYLDDQDWAAGPVGSGTKRLSAGKKLHWEMGLLFGLNSDTPDTLLRGGIEFEF